MRKHCRDELDLEETKANAQVAGFLFNSARSGTRWRETPVEFKHSGSIGRRDVSELTDEDLLNIIGSVGAELQASPRDHPAHRRRGWLPAICHSAQRSADLCRTPAANGSPVYFLQ
jgi:hypothetical protein